MKRMLFISLLGVLALAATGVLATRAEAARAAAQESDARIVVVNPDGTCLSARSIQLESQDPRRGPAAIALRSVADPDATDAHEVARGEASRITAILTQAVEAAAQAAPGKESPAASNRETELRAEAERALVLDVRARQDEAAARGGFESAREAYRSALIEALRMQDEDGAGQPKTWWEVRSQSKVDPRLLERVEALERAARDRGWTADAGDRSIEERVAELERVLNPNTPRPQAPAAPERNEIRVEHTPGGWLTVRERSPEPPTAPAPDAPRIWWKRSPETGTPPAPEAVPTPAPPVEPRAPRAARPPERAPRAASRVDEPRMPRLNDLFEPRSDEAATRARLERTLEELRADAQRLREEMRRLRTEIERLPRDSER